MNSYATWRAAVEADLSGRSFESALVKKTHDGLRIEPLYETGGVDRPLPPRVSLPTTGAVLAGGRAAPEGPALAWWRGQPGAVSSTTKTVVAETVAEVAPIAKVSVIVVGRRASAHARLASPAALEAAEAGAGAIAELASALVALGRALEGGAAPQTLAVALTSSTDFFVDISKLRAARRGIAGMLAHSGHPERALPLLVRQTHRSLAATDVATNALRSTLACASGLIGGATHVALFPHDASLALGAPAGPAARLAWTQGEVLTRESHLDLFGDASLGAPLIASLTEQIGEAAWALARAALGGDEGPLTARIEADALARAQAFATRKRALVGVSRFVGAQEGAGDPARDAAPFEHLRTLSGGAPALVLAVGDRKNEARVDFAREILELLGATVSIERKSDLAGALSAVPPHAGLVILAMADGAFATDGVALAAALLARGSTVLMAGKPGPAEDALKAAGVKAFVYQGADLVRTLAALFEQGGVS